MQRIEMKVFSVSLFLTGLTFAAHGQLPVEVATSTNDLRAEGLRGKVKSITTRGFKAEPGIQGTVLKGNLVHTTIKKYNAAGYLLESTSSIGGNTINGKMLPYRSARIVYRYDNHNNLTGSCSYDTYGRLQDSSIHFVDKMGNRIYWQIYKGNGFQEWEYISEYDNAGRLLETNDFHHKKLLTRHTYKYNERGECVLENDLNPDGTLKSKKLYKYDPNGYKTESEEWSGNGSFLVRHTYQYNAMGKVIEDREYKQDGVEKYSKITTEYDSEGNVTGVKQYAENGKILYAGKMDKYGNHLSDIGYNPDGSVHDKITADYKYDEYGNEIEELLNYGDGSAPARSTYKYVYDMDLNWIKKTVWEDGKPVRVTEREIDYY
jgi:hypothetical protein